MSTATAISLLRRVALGRDFAKMNRSTVKGFLAELLVKKRLEDEGLFVDHLGNQKGYDLRFNAGNIQVRADVKMSLPKDEFGWGFDYWGWALQHDNKKKADSATHFICVGCSESLELEALFVVQASRVRFFPRGTRQFRNVKHGLVIVRNSLPARSDAFQDSLFLGSQKRLRAGDVVRVGPNQRLADTCG